MSAPPEARTTNQKVTLRLIPFLFVLYVFNYLDRTSVAFATLGMSRDLGFNDEVFGLSVGMFFIGYLGLQIPGALLVERWSARKMITITMVIWGSLTMLTSFIHTPHQLYLARFALGVAEAGFFPGVIVYLSHWFVRRDRAKATGRFMSAIPLSVVLGSPLAGWLLGRHWLGVQGWRWLFVLEGLPAILLGFVAFFYLTDRPRQAAWLPADSRQWLEEKLAEEKAHKAHAITIGQALRSPAILLLTLVCFLEYVVAYNGLFWLPTILKRQSGLSDLWVGILGAIPYIVALIAMLINGWHSDHTHERRWHAAVPVIIAALALLGLITLPASTFSMVFLFSMLSVVFAFLPAFWAIPTEVLSASAAAAAVGMINSIANTAGFAGPYMFGYLRTRTGSLTWGFVVTLLCALACMALILRIPKSRPAA